PGRDPGAVGHARRSDARTHERRGARRQASGPPRFLEDAARVRRSTEQGAGAVRRAAALVAHAGHQARRAARRARDRCRPRDHDSFRRLDLARRRRRAARCRGTTRHRARTPRAHPGDHMTDLTVMTDDEIARYGTNADSGFGALETERGVLPLVALRVRARVSGVVAATEVVQTFANTTGVAIEA